jgi:hypothetical protein
VLQYAWLSILVVCAPICSECPIKLCQYFLIYRSLANNSYHHKTNNSINWLISIRYLFESIECVLCPVFSGLSLECLIWPVNWWVHYLSEVEQGLQPVHCRILTCVWKFLTAIAYFDAINICFSFRCLHPEISITIPCAPYKQGDHVSTHTSFSFSTFRHLHFLLTGCHCSLLLLILSVLYIFQFKQVRLQQLSKTAILMVLSYRCFFFVWYDTLNGSFLEWIKCYIMHNQKTNYILKKGTPHLSQPHQKFGMGKSQKDKRSIVPWV